MGSLSDIMVNFKYGNIVAEAQLTYIGNEV
jgi:hypothetical protein